MQEENPLTLEDHAAILAGDNDLVDATARRLATFFRHDPHFASQRQQLSDLARQAGLAPEAPSYRDAVSLHAAFDRLLAAGDWQDPAQVLDPEGDKGLELGKLLCIAEARAARPEAPEGLARLRRRLEQIHEADQKALRQPG